MVPTAVLVTASRIPVQLPSIGTRAAAAFSARRRWFSAELTPTKKKAIMFVCKRNSCRSQPMINVIGPCGSTRLTALTLHNLLASYISERTTQMAEGWAKHIAKNDLEIWSSGLEGSRVHPTAKRVMEEVGVDITSHTSDFLHDFSPSSFDAVVSMCGCGTSLPEPWQQAELFEDWELDDPDGKPLETFRRVRSEIKDHVVALVGKMERGHVTTQNERDEMSRGDHRREC